MKKNILASSLIIAMTFSAITPLAIAFDDNSNKEQKPYIQFNEASDGSINDFMKEESLNQAASNNQSEAIIDNNNEGFSFWDFIMSLFSSNEEEKQDNTNQVESLKQITHIEVIAEQNDNTPKNIQEYLTTEEKVVTSTSLPEPLPVIKPIGKIASFDIPTKQNSCKDNIDDRVYQWKKNWESKDFEQYLSSYSKDFSANTTRSEWEELRKERIENSKFIKVTVKNLKIKEDNGIFHATFDQEFDSGNYKNKVVKRLTFNDIKGNCLITSEDVVKGKLY